MAKTVAPGLALSYVNRVAGLVHLRLHLPAFEATPGVVPRVRAAKGAVNRVADAQVSPADKGVYLDVTFAGKPMTAGAWRIDVSPRKGGVYEATGSRIVIADPNPITFLIGFDPIVQVPAPMVPGAVHTLPAKQKLAHSAGLLADRALVNLPPKQAASIRSTLRSVARKASSVLPG